MSSSKQRNIFLFLSKVILIALLILFIVRSFLIEPYTVSSSQMQTAIEEGDYVFVDKTAYGIRMPVTPLSIPFVFDTFFGRKSYSSVFLLSYKRFFEKPVELNDVVLFNNPFDDEKPLDKRELIMSRCVALPGDTIEIIGDSYIIDSKYYVFSPDYMEEYQYPLSHEEPIRYVSQEQDIPLRNRKQNMNTDTVSVFLNKYEAFIINEVLPDSITFQHNESEPVNYKFVIPHKGQTIRLDDTNIAVYKQTILFEQGDSANFVNDKLVINGNSQEYYTFQEDYYWLLSDNHNNSVDSRVLGFIPFSNIIGRISHILYRPDQNGSGLTDNFFIQIK